MHSDMSKKTKDEVLRRLRWRYATAGKEHKVRLLNQAVELLGYHRKAAIRALRQLQSKKAVSLNLVIGRPKTYHPETLLPFLKPIWFSAFQPCGSRLHALLPEWLPAYELDHRRIDPDLRQCLLHASARTLDRLIAPLRVGLAGRGGTRPGSLLRQSIPIRGSWTEEGPGWLEVDTVAMCGGALDDKHLWMLDGVDIRTDWTELRALENRGQAATLKQIAHLEANLPFSLLGLDSDNGGEFINHHLVAYLEQRNWTHVRQHFGYERYDNPAVAALINRLCVGALGQLLKHFLPTHLLKEKRRKANRTVRVYGPPLTPYARVLAAGEVTPAKKAELQKLHEQLNPFALAREVERQKKAINAQRLLTT